MSKHTPGPWKICIGTPIGLEIRNSDKSLVLAVLPITTFDPSDNAHLIAAAPELLHILKHLVYQCQCTVKERDSGHRIDCDVPKALEIIAKAEGRE